jgi:hypothetical protein
MVAPNYAKTRSSLAKSMGLGRKAGAASSDAVAVVPRVEEAPAAPQESAKTAMVVEGPRKPLVKKEQAAA